jgi:type II secretory pathway predicted ATPase ExeA
MYKDFFGLQEFPFNVNPDPRFLVQTRDTDEALACMIYGIQQRRGFVLLTGEVGTGKTTLVNKLLEWLKGEKMATAFIFYPRLTTNQFLDLMIADFGITKKSHLKSQVLLQLNEWLLKHHQAGQTAVLIVDEAQNLSSDVLEEIRLMTNLETSSEKLLQIVLSGQPELEHKLNQPHLRQLRQRITLRCKTAPLTYEETQAYIAERLRIAGSNGGMVFTPEAVEVVHQFSAGVPRLINLLCDHSLITGFAEQQKPVPARVVEGVARDFELERFEPVSQPVRGNGSRASNGRGTVLSQLRADLKNQWEKLRKGPHEPNS